MTNEDNLKNLGKKPEYNLELDYLDKLILKITELRKQTRTQIKHELMAELARVALLNMNANFQDALDDNKFNARIERLAMGNALKSENANRPIHLYSSNIPKQE